MALTPIPLAGAIKQETISVRVNAQNIMEFRFNTSLPQDMLFATFASCVVYFIGFQAFVLYGATRTGDFSAINLFFAVFLLVIALYNVALGAGEFLPWWSLNTHWWAFSVVHYLGLGKSFCSLIKYIPQVILNYKKQNTVYV
jgi:hypothetical protein